MKKGLILGVILALVLAFWPGVSKAQGPLVAVSGGKLAVTPAGYDDMGKVLSSMGYSAEEISWEDLSNLEKLKGFSAVYINCSSGADGSAEAAAPVIKQYVEEGGIIYASDFADAIVSKAFPGKITFYGSGFMGSRAGAVGKVTANVVDGGMAAVLGKSAIEINFDLPSWAVMQSTTGRTYMTGSAPILDLGSYAQNFQNFDTSDPTALQKQIENMQSQASKVLPNLPLVVSFEAGKGEVLYTSFHNEAQVTEDVTKVLNWFANRAQAAGLAQQSRALAEGTDKTLLEIVDSLKKDQTKSYVFNATGQADFTAVLNFGGSSLEIVIKDPLGKMVSTETVSQPPYQKAIAGAQKGKYTMSVTAKDIPNDNYPFVLTVLGPQNAGAVQVAQQGSTASKVSPASTNLILAYWPWAAGAAGVIILVIILVIFSVARRKKP